VNRFQEVVFIPIVTSLTDDNLRVDYTISSGVGNSTASDLVADFDNDGNVNFNDFLTFADGFGVAPLSPSHNPRSDLNGDGPVDFHDFLLFASHFGESR
jgi:Ca2+-binding EF-hand superfamily protein